jgi:hypothetical protein
MVVVVETQSYNTGNGSRSCRVSRSRTLVSLCSCWEEKASYCGICIDCWLRWLAVTPRFREQRLLWACLVVLAVLRLCTGRLLVRAPD